MKRYRLHLCISIILLITIFALSLLVLYSFATNVQMANSNNPNLQESSPIYDKESIQLQQGFSKQTASDYIANKEDNKFSSLESGSKLSSNETISWGLSHKNNETTPNIPKNAKQMLDNHNGIYVGDTNQKKIYLTFDLGYEPGNTHQILDTLKSNHANAIFFLNTNYLKETSLVNRMLNEGHSIGNHTSKHKDLPTLNLQEIKTDIQNFKIEFDKKYNNESNSESNKEINNHKEKKYNNDTNINHTNSKVDITPNLCNTTEIEQNNNNNPTKHKLIFFRPPYGRFNNLTLQEAARQGYKTVLWSNAIKDWERVPLNITKSTKIILERTHPGQILLLHANAPNVAEFLQNIIKQTKSLGYQIGHPNELLS